MPSCSCEIRFLVSDKIYFYDLWYWNRHRALCLAARKTDAIEFYLPGLKCPFDLLPSLRRRPQELHSHRLPYIIYRVIFLAHFMLRDLGNLNLSGRLVPELGKLEHLQYLLILCGEGIKDTCWG